MVLLAEEEAVLEMTKSIRLGAKEASQRSQRSLLGGRPHRKHPATNVVNKPTYNESILSWTEKSALKGHSSLSVDSRPKSDFNAMDSPSNVWFLPCLTHFHCIHLLISLV